MHINASMKTHLFPMPFLTVLVFLLVAAPIGCGSSSSTDNSNSPDDSESGSDVTGDDEGNDDGDGDTGDPFFIVDNAKFQGGSATLDELTDDNEDTLTDDDLEVADSLTPIIVIACNDTVGTVTTSGFDFAVYDFDEGGGGPNTDFMVEADGQTMVFTVTSALQSAKTYRVILTSSAAANEDDQSISHYEFLFITP